MDYLKIAMDLSRKSLEAGKFPAGAVVVTEKGNLYESDPSLPYYHAECSAIDKAIKAEGYPIKRAVVYSSMEPCLMCLAKMYWSNIDEINFIIPKDMTDTKYAYEDPVPLTEHSKAFYIKMNLRHDNRLLKEALQIYQSWFAEINNSVE